MELFRIWVRVQGTNRWRVIESFDSELDGKLRLREIREIGDGLDYLYTEYLRDRGSQRIISGIFPKKFRREA